MIKMSKIKKLSALAVLIFAGITAQAQLSHLEQSFFLNGNIPTTDFGQSYTAVPMTQDHMASDAIMGMGFGYRASYRFDIGFGEVSPYLHADFQWNAISGDHRDAYTLQSCKTPTYFNVPLFAGVNYRYQLTEIFTPFAEFGLGADFLFITKEGGASGIPTLKYKTTSAFAWQVGLGTFLGQHVSASLHYNGYGKHTIQYTSKTVDDIQGTIYQPASTIQTSQLRRIGVLSMRIGFHF